MNRDLRLKLFYILLGIGCLAHEIQFIHRQFIRIGSFLDYIEKWREVGPILSIPQELMLLIHLSFIGLSIALIFSKHRSVIAFILAPLLIIKIFTYPPPGVSNHYIMMVFALLANFLFLLFRAFVIWRNNRYPYNLLQARDVEGALFKSLKHILCLTYFFAFFHKLNSGWLSTGNNFAGDFLIPCFKPVLSLINVPDAVVFHYLSLLSIYSTLAIEFSLPILLLIQLTRVLGCVVGIIFHIIMMTSGIFDFPSIILAFYPLFFEEDELRNILTNRILKVTPGKFYVSFAIGVYFITIYQNPVSILKFIMSKFESLGAINAIYLIETIFGYLLILGWVYIGCSLVWYLFKVPIRVPIVYYDGMCTFCQSIIKSIERLNIGGNLHYEELNESGSLQKSGLTKEDCLGKIKVSVDSRVFSGFLAFRVILRNLGLLSFLYPLLYFPGVNPIGERVYNRVAKGRY
jgi:predicted DCC family thiol-disulfide oxidoreductase YuxK